MADTIGRRIRQAREQAGFSQETLAEKMEVSRQAVSKWESGQSRPSAQNLIRLSRVLEIPLEELTQTPKPAEPAASAPSAEQEKAAELADSPERPAPAPAPREQSQPTAVEYAPPRWPEPPAVEDTPVIRRSPVKQPLTARQRLTDFLRTHNRAFGFGLIACALALGLALRGVLSNLPWLLFSQMPQATAIIDAVQIETLPSSSAPAFVTEDEYALMAGTGEAITYYEEPDLATPEGMRAFWEDECGYWAQELPCLRFWSVENLDTEVDSYQVRSGLEYQFSLEGGGILSLYRPDGGDGLMAAWSSDGKNWTTIGWFPGDEFGCRRFQALGVSGIRLESIYSTDGHVVTTYFAALDGEPRIWFQSDGMFMEEDLDGDGMAELAGENGHEYIVYDRAEETYGAFCYVE